MIKELAKGIGCFAGVGCLGIVGFIVIGVVGIGYIGTNQIKVQTEYYSQHRDEILKTAREDYDAKQYDNVIAIAEQYAIVSDPELRKLGNSAERLRKELRIATLRAEIPNTVELPVKIDKLKQLIKLAPDDSDAKKLLAEIETKPAPKAKIKSRVEYIPGLTAVDVHGNFTNKGFTLTKDFDDPNQMIWTCTEENAAYQATVQVYGQSPTNITLVRATYYNYSPNDTDQRGKEFMAYVASTPYDGSDQSKAKSWVKSKMGMNATVSIGSATFELIASAPRVRVLLIQPANN